MVKVISTECQIKNELELLFRCDGKDTKTMHDITYYDCLVAHKTDNERGVGVYGTVYVTFFTNNKGERCYKYSQEVILYDFTMSKTFNILKKKQVEQSRVITYNDAERIKSNTFENIKGIVENEFNKLSK